MQPKIESVQVADLKWVKSSYSGTNGNCVEVAVLPAGARAVRDSKRPDSPLLVVSADQWGALAAGIADGRFTQP